MLCSAVNGRRLPVTSRTARPPHLRRFIQLPRASARWEPLETNEHSIRVKLLEDAPLSRVVAQLLSHCGHAGLPVDELLRLGAVYTGVAIKGQPVIKWTRSVDLPAPAGDALVPSGQLVRVHPQPKRFPACYQRDWPSRVLHVCDDYLVVDKPRGLPCMRHESNAAEEVAACAGAALGLQGLEVCHRLDQWTTGVLVLSRNKQANKDFKRSLEAREPGLAKTYRALTHGPVALGPMTHHMYDGPFNAGAPVLGGGTLKPRGPRLLSGTAHAGWKVCELVVEECKVHPGGLAWAQSHVYSSSPFGAVQPCEPVVYESTIRLLTGRTHQIRAQLAAAGCPLVGDVMYGPIAGLVVGADGMLSDPGVVRQVEELPVLDGPIGLHAWKLEWRGREFVAEPDWA